MHTRTTNGITGQTRTVHLALALSPPQSPPTPASLLSKKSTTHKSAASRTALAASDAASSRISPAATLPPPSSTTTTNFSPDDAQTDTHASAAWDRAPPTTQIYIHTPDTAARQAPAGCIHTADTPPHARSSPNPA